MKKWLGLFLLTLSIFLTSAVATANVPLKAGDVLFRIDPTPYSAQVKAIEAQLKLSATRLAQMTQLFERDSGRGFDVEQRQSEVDQLKAQLEGAQWNLDKTTVRAPTDGYVTNLALRKGARVANLPLSPVMAFHRHVEHADWRRARPDRRTVCRAGTGGRGHLQISSWAGIYRQGRDGPAGDRNRTGSDLRSCRTIEGYRSSTLCRARQARRCHSCRQPAGRQHGHGRDFYGSREGRPRHPQGIAAPDRDHELRQPVLTGV